MKPNFTKILVTGIPGSDWDETTNEFFLETFKDRMANEHGLVVETFSVRELIYQFAKEEHVALVPHRIQRSSDEKIRLLRRLAFTNLEKHVSLKDPASEIITVIRTSATSYSDHGKEESLTRRYLTEVKPDLFVCTIDDPVTIYNRIPKLAEAKKYAYLKLDDLIRWMENEVAEMQELALDFGCPLFVIPRRQVSALIDLVTTSKKTAYVSYAMTKASDDAKTRTKSLVDKLKSHFVVFDPACMGSAHAETIMTDEEINFYRDDVKKRDEQWFIGINSEYTIVYLPEEIPAHGSQTELDTASELGKTVWVVLEPGYSNEIGRLTPFIDQPSDTVFISSEEFEFFLDLSQDEQEVYASITKVMWGFKRRGSLRPLTDMTRFAVGMKIGEEDVTSKFLQEVKERINDQLARGIINVITDERLLELTNRCWESNRPVWHKRIDEAQVVPLFRDMDIPIREVVRHAARDVVHPAGVDIDLPALSRPEDGSEKPKGNDREVFEKIFVDHALVTNLEDLFGRLDVFFKARDLGSFEQRADFLMFLKFTLDKHRYKSAEVFNEKRLTKWYTEFDQGRSEGTRL